MASRFFLRSRFAHFGRRDSAADHRVSHQDYCSYCGWMMAMVIIIKVHHYHHCIVHCGQPGLQRRSLQVLLGQSSPCLPAVHSGAEKDDDGDDDDDD